MTVLPISHKTFLYAYAVISKNYSGGQDIMIEISLADDGVVIMDKTIPVGVCLVKYDKDMPLVMDCVVNEQYKGTKFAYRLLREMKRLTNRGDFKIAFEGDSYEYKGSFNSVRHIVDTKGKSKIDKLDVIRGK